MRLLVALAAAAAWAATSVASAPAASCAQRLIADWTDNGRIDRVYAPACYPAAIAALPEDVLAYGTAAEDIERALRDRARMLEAQQRTRTAARPAKASSPSRSLSAVKPAAATPKATAKPNAAGKERTGTTSEPAAAAPHDSDAGTPAPEAVASAAAENTSASLGPWAAAAVGALLLLAGAGWATVRRIRVR